MEPTWRQAVESPSPGEYVATCLRAEHAESAAGNKCIRWTFSVEGCELARTTVQRRKETGQTALALGLPKAFRLSQAIGRSCRVIVKQDGVWLSIDSVRPL